MSLFFVFICLNFVVILTYAACPPGSVTYFKNKNLCLNFNTTKTYYLDAEEICINLGGHLVSVHDATDNMFLSQQALVKFTDSTDSNFWFGASDLSSPQKWTWMDETPFDYENWDKGQPQDTSGSDCGAIFMNGGKWKSDDCYTKKPFVCEFQALSPPTTTISTTTPPPKPISCKPSWTYNVINGTVGFCYKAFDNATWLDAENTCKLEAPNGHLASVHSFEEALFIASLAHTPEYKGDCNGWKMAWIGGYTDDNNAHWYWTDGTPFNYTQWPGDLNHPFSTFQRSCTLKYLTAECGSSEATFDNWPCERLLAKYICKYAPN